MGVVQGCISHTYNYVRKASEDTCGIHQAALAAEYGGVVLIVDGVAHKIRSRVELAQGILGAFQFLPHDGKQDVVVLWSFCRSRRRFEVPDRGLRQNYQKAAQQKSSKPIFHNGRL